MTLLVGPGRPLEKKVGINYTSSIDQGKGHRKEKDPLLTLMMRGGVSSLKKEHI